MDLRPELLPPQLDEELVARLADLASTIDGARPGEWEEELAEFNSQAGTSIPFEEFQGISGAEEHAEWVRRVLWHKTLTPDPAITQAEMTEIVRRISGINEHTDYYVALFGINCRHPSGTDLIFWPGEVPEFPKGREPTADEIADLALRGPS